MFKLIKLNKFNIFGGENNQMRLKISMLIVWSRFWAPGEGSDFKDGSAGKREPEGGGSLTKKQRP